MKIGLLGFSFQNANLGCEALSYSFISMLQEIVTKEEITIYNGAYGIDIGRVPEQFPNIIFEPLHIKFKKPKTTIQKFRQCDIVFDITYGDNFADIYSPKFVFRTTLAKQFVLCSKTRLVLAPQTYGPFQRKMLQRFAAHVIKKSNVVFSRDEMSSFYVKKLTNRQPITVTDLAFALPYSRISLTETQKTRIGVNVSGLLWKGGFYKENQFGLTVDYQRYMYQLIEKLRSMNYEIHLIPHVIESVPNSNDGDVYVCRLLHEKYPDTILAPEFRTPVEAKSYIAAMDVFTGARMHATVDAFSAYVPTIPFAYSRKFHGLYQNVGYSYLVDGCKLSTVEAVEHTIRLLEEKDKVKIVLEQSMKKVNQKLDMFRNELKKLLQ